MLPRLAGPSPIAPTPPSSNRPSLEESQGLPDPLRVTYTPTQVISHTKAGVPPGHFTPPTPPSSPGHETSDSILKSFQDVASRVVSSVDLALSAVSLHPSWLKYHSSSLDVFEESQFVDGILRGTRMK